MSQQPWGQPAPQSMAEAWPTGQGPEPAPQAPANQNDSGSFFGGMGGGGEVIPSFKFGGTGSAVQGQVQSCQVVGVSDYTTGETIVDARTGQEAKQLKIVLQTTYRNWEHVSRIPTDDDGNQKGPHEDDGRRAIYTGGKSSTGQSWMSGAINDALRAAGRDSAKGIEIGAMLGVAVSEEVPSGKGNPYKKYVAKYSSPSQAAPQQAQAPQAPAQAPAPQPQAPQAAPPQAPQGNPFEGYQPPAQPAPAPQQPSPTNPWGGGSEQPPF